MSAASAGRHLQPVGAHRRRATPRRPTTGAGAAALQLLGDQERQLQRLFRVQPRVAEGLVALGQVRLGQPVRAADALGDVLAGHLDVHAARPGALGRVDVEEAAHLRQDVVEPAGLHVVRHRDGVAVHRVGDPHHLVAGPLHRAHQRRQPRGDLFRAHAADQRDAPGLVGRIERCRGCAADRPAPASGRTSCRSGSSPRAGTRHGRRRPGGCGRRSTGSAPSSRTTRRWWNRRGSAPAHTAAAAPRARRRNRSRAGRAWSRWSCRRRS